MFKQPSVIRRRVMDAVENKIRKVEEAYESSRNDLIARQTDELSRMSSRHDDEHEELVSSHVREIVSKIL